MKSAAPLIAAGGGLIAVIVGVIFFGDLLGSGSDVSQPEKPVAALTSDNGAGKQAKSAEKTAPAKEAVAKDEKPVAPSKSEPKPVEKAEVKEKEKAPAPASTADEKLAEASKDPVSPSKEAVADKVVTAGIQPSFDIVRVEPDGNTLVAGKASPGWIVDLKDGDKVIGTAIADANGDWVLILEEALRRGVSDLSLAAKAKEGGEALTSGSRVTVMLPEDGKGELLVVENTPGKASKVLAKIVDQAKKEASKPAETVVADKAEKPAATEMAKVAGKSQDSAEKAPSADSDANKKVASEIQAKAKTEDVAKTSEQAAEKVEATKEAPAKMEQAEKPKEGVAAVKEEKPVEQPAKPEPVVVRSVTIEAVEVEGSTLFVAGAAQPSRSIVRLYVDNVASGDSLSGETGRYLFDGKIELAPGQHTIRVDLLDGKTGKVAKRAEVSFNKKAPAPQIAKTETNDSTALAVVKTAEPNVDAAPRKVIIRRGDNLWEIARRVYGAGVRFSTIYDVNKTQIRDPHWIYPGQVFELPEGQEGWDVNFDAAEKPPVAE